MPTDRYQYHYLTSGAKLTQSGKKAKKLLMSDNFGNQYNIDGIIANQYLQPLILFESKYLRYKKHNRDKGSWICMAHSAVRKRYHSIRSSIAILAGSWSQSSLTMMRSYDITLFVIPFESICRILQGFNIDFNWDEKDQQKAKQAWDSFNQLTEGEKSEIGKLMIDTIQNPLIKLIDQILDDTIIREVNKVVLEIVSNLGEVKVYEFETIEEAVKFLEAEDIMSLFITEDSLTLFD